MHNCKGRMGIELMWQKVRPRLKDFSRFTGS